MKKRIFMAIVAILITGLLVAPSMAKGKKIDDGEKGPNGQAVGYSMAKEKKFKEGEKGPNGPAGKSNIGHVYLYEKDASDDAYPIVEGGAWGKMKYNLSGPAFDFVFNGHGLPLGESFTLIYYPDPWPGSGLICLGSGIATCDCEPPCTECSEGSVHIQGSYDTGDLPKEDDYNIDLGEESGAKIWLVLKDDVECEEGIMIGWNPDAYLFEGELITFDDTDDVN